MNKISRKSITVWVCFILLVLFTYALWPKPILVDIEDVYKGSMQMTVDEEGYGSRAISNISSF